MTKGTQTTKEHIYSLGKYILSSGMPNSELNPRGRQQWERMMVVHRPLGFHVQERAGDVLLWHAFTHTHHTLTHKLIML